MPRSSLSLVATLALVALTGPIGCASPTTDRTAGMSPAKIYSEAKEELAAGAYDKAIPLLEKLEGRAAGTLLAHQAQLDKAYAQYKSQEPAQALATLDRFIRLHPASPALDYALYLKGIINFNDDLGLFSGVTRQDLSERDQKAAKESYESFDELVNRFPESTYTPDARLRMNYIVNSLARYEVHVARYYYTRGAYLAAINRAQQAIADYRSAPALEEAMFIMVKSYEALNLPQLRDDAKRVLEINYPNSEYLKRGFQGKSGPWWKMW